MLSLLAGWIIVTVVWIILDYSLICLSDARYDAKEYRRTHRVNNRDNIYISTDRRCVNHPVNHRRLE